MQPLSADQVDDLDDFICIDASGTIVSIKNDLLYFILHEIQYVVGGHCSDYIVLHAELQNNPKWNDPLEHLLKLRGIVSVFGHLCCFDYFCCFNNQTICYLVIDIEDITYLYAPS